MQKRTDLLFMVVLPAVAIVISLLGQVNFFVSTLLFLGLPSLWLSIRIQPRKLIKIILYALLFAVPVSLVVDYVGTVSSAYFITDTIFSFRLFDVVVLEQFLWGILYVYFILLFYEYFFDRGKDKIFERRIKWLAILLFAALCVFSFLLALNPSAFFVPYAYSVLGFAFIIVPLFAVLVSYPRLLPKFAAVGFYLFLFWIPYELVSLQLNHWTFPGNEYIGWVTVFGFGFSLEELLWFVFTGPAALAYYEFFDDDRK